MYTVRLFWFVAGLALAAATFAQGDGHYELPQELRATAAQSTERGYESDLAWRVVESLTTEIGPRLAGSEQEARARGR